MSALIKQLAIQLRMDVRDKGTLLVFYLVPLGFYVVVGAVFSSVNPGIKPVLSATMAVFAISMGALIGVPPTLVKLRESGTLRAYQVSGIPGTSVLLSTGVSAFVHLSVVSVIISVSAPLLFGAEMPQSIGGFIAALSVLLLCSVAIGLFIGTAARAQTSAMLLSQAVFMPSLMLSGIMFPAELLPAPLGWLGSIFPATHAMRAFAGLAYGHTVEYSPLLALGIVLGISLAASVAAVWQLGRITKVA
jgi:ABC-2 type transport system permease protein